MYGGALGEKLDSRYKLPDHVDIPEIPFCEIHDENSLESLLDLWNRFVVSKALAKAQKGGFTDKPIYMCKGGQALFPDLRPNKKKDDTKGYRPDWAGAQRLAGDRATPWNILPGETKPSIKWDSSKLPSDYDTEYPTSPDFLEPIRQIFTYCVKSNSRYGYLITDRELLAIRIRSDPPLPTAGPGGAPADQTKAGGLEFKLIPWSNDSEKTAEGSEGMTVNLGLWGLHMMTIFGRDIQESYPSLKETPRAYEDQKVNSQTSRSGLDEDPQASSRRSTRQGQSFRSEASAVGHRLSDASLNADNGHTSPGPTGSRRKRSWDEPVEESSRGQQRTNKHRRGKGR